MTRVSSSCGSGGLSNSASGTGPPHVVGAILGESIVPQPESLVPQPPPWDEALSAPQPEYAVVRREVNLADVGPWPARELDVGVGGLGGAQLLAEITVRNHVHLDLCVRVRH